VTVHLDAGLERDIPVRSQGSRHDTAAFDDAKRPVATPASGRHPVYATVS